MGLGVSAFLANRVELGYSFMVAFVVKDLTSPAHLRLTYLAHCQLVYKLNSLSVRDNKTAHSGERQMCECCPANK